MKYLTAVLFLLSILGISHSNQIKLTKDQVVRGSFVVVGKDINDSECDFFTIQGAIDSGATEVRIATETYSESLNINDQNIELLGGYNTCTQAANMNGFNPSQIAVIDAENGNFTEPGITIIGNSSRRIITLRNLRVQEGKGLFLTAGGGISTFNANAAINLLNIELIDNEGLLGGGMSLIGGNTDVTAVNLLVRNNTAPEGGGIFCSGSDVSIVLSDNNGALKSGIRFNTATDGNGGGVLMQSECELTTYTGTSTSNSFDLRGITFNLALNGNGGGIALDSGSKLFLLGSEECSGSNCIGNNSHPININANEAESSNTGSGVGGGIYATGIGTEIIAKSINLSSNVAQRSGGGAFIGTNAAISILRAPLPCWSIGLCNQIDSNRSGTSGGGLLIAASSSTEINYTHLRNNRANNGVAAFIGLGITPTPAKITSSIISGNGDNGNGVYQDNNAIYSASNLDIKFSTIVDNQVQDQTFFQSAATNSNELNIFASIIHNPGEDVYGSEGNTTLVANCLLVNEEISFDGSNVLVENPDFIDRINGDYHIAGSSPAIDMCQADAFLRGEFHLDLDAEIRGFDDASVVNLVGPFDAGADETYSNDIIYADGFE